MIDHVRSLSSLILQDCDNDFDSDADQVKTNTQVLMTELKAAIDAFVKKDPLDLVVNLLKDPENRLHPTVEQ